MGLGALLQKNKIEIESTTVGSSLIPVGIINKSCNDEKSGSVQKKTNGHMGWCL